MFKEPADLSHHHRQFKKNTCLCMGSLTLRLMTSRRSPAPSQQSKRSPRSYTSTHNQRIATSLFTEHGARKPLDNRHEFGETHWTRKRLCTWVAHVETDDVSEPPGSIIAIQTIARIMHKHTKSNVYAQTQTIEFKGCNAMSRMQRD